MSFSIAYYVSEWIIRIVMLVVVTRHRQPTSAMAWLLIIFFQPWAGLILYGFLGRNSLARRRIERHSRLLDEMQHVAGLLKDHPNIVKPVVDSSQEPAVIMTERLGMMPILGGNDVELIVDTYEVIDQLIEDIDGARDHIHLMFYIIADDTVGRRVTDAMIQAVRRGVICRVLVDQVGSRGRIGNLADYMRDNGIQFQTALPVSIVRSFFHRIDLRNHRKIVVIDGNIGYTGSQNITEPAYGRSDKLSWYDLMVRLTGPAVLELQSIFMSDWYFETAETLNATEIFPSPVATGSVPIQTLPSGPNFPTENYQRLIVTAMYAARKHVALTTPYFVPDQGFMQAIESAAQRGVSVELIVPLQSNQHLVMAASHAYYDDLLDAGVSIYSFTKGLLHTKSMCVDRSLSFIGTSNFDIRSFALNFEVNLVLYDKGISEALLAEIEQYKKDSILMNSEEWSKRPEIAKIGQQIAKLMSPVL